MGGDRTSGVNYENIDDPGRARPRKSLFLRLPHLLSEICAAVSFIDTISAVQCSAVYFSALHFSDLQCSVVQCSAVQCSTV